MPCLFLKLTKAGIAIKLPALMRMRLPELVGIGAACSIAVAMLSSSALAQGEAAAKSDAPPPTEQKAAAPKAPKTDSLKALEDNLFKPFQDSLNPDHTLDPPLPRSRVTSPAQEKKRRDAIDRKKNWVFMTPEEMLTGENPNELLGQDGTGKNPEDKDMTPMQRYMYRRLYPSKDSKTANPNLKRDPWDLNKRDPLDPRKDLNGDGDSDDSESKGDAKEKNRKKDTDKASLKENEAKKRTPSMFSDIFGSTQPELTKEQERTEKARLDAYKQSLGLPVTPSFQKSVSAFALPAAAVPAKPVDISPTATKPSGFGAQLGTISALPSLPGLTPSPVSQPFGGPSFAPAVLPAPEPAKMLPPQSTFSAPKRSF